MSLSVFCLINVKMDNTHNKYHCLSVLSDADSFFSIPLVLSNCTNSWGVEYVFINGILVAIYL